MLCLLFLLPVLMSVSSDFQDKELPPWMLEGQEDLMMGLTMVNSSGNMTHHCLGVQVEGTKNVLTTCSCLGRVDGGLLVKPNITIQIHPNPSFLGWGNEGTNSSDFELSRDCLPRTHIAFPWASDLGIVRLNSSILLRQDYGSRTWISNSKSCSDDVKWSFLPPEDTPRTCYTYSTEGPFLQLYSNLVYVIPHRECEMTLCESHPELCDVNLSRQGILCTSLPRSFNDCLPVGSPLFCGSAVFGLSVRPFGPTTCDPWPVLLFQVVLPEMERSGLILPWEEREMCRERQERGISLNPTNEHKRHLLIVFNIIFTLLYKRFRA